MKRFLLSAVAFSLGVTAQDCGIPVELVIVQDLTSFAWHDPEENVDYTLPHYRHLTATALVRIADYLAEHHEGSRIGLVSFRDKPFHPYGDEGEYCAKVDGALTDVASVSDIVDQLESSLESTGRDQPDANYYGIWYSAVHPAIDWTELNYDPSIERNDRARIVIQVTNTRGYTTETSEGTCQDARCPLKPHESVFDLERQDEDCETMNYPEHDTVRDALVDNEIRFGTLLLRPDWRDVDPEVETDLAAAAWLWSFQQFYPGEYGDTFPEDDDRLVRLRLADIGAGTLRPTASDDYTRELLRVMRSLIRDACGSSDMSTEEENRTDPSTEYNGGVTSDSDDNGGDTEPSSTPPTRPPGVVSTATIINEQGSPIGLIVGVTVGGATAVGLVAGAVTKWGMRPAEAPHFEELESN